MVAVGGDASVGVAVGGIGVGGISVGRMNGGGVGAGRVAPGEHAMVLITTRMHVKANVILLVNCGSWRFY